MANIDTPGYQTLDMNFESEMRNALSDVDRGGEANPVVVHASSCADSVLTGKRTALAGEPLSD
jgi:flagellar basal body rod protein FlgB